MKIYVRKNGYEPRAFLTKEAAFDALKEEMDFEEVVEAFAFILGGVQRNNVLSDIVNYVAPAYRDLVVDTYLENFFDEDFDEYEVADPEDLDELAEEL